MISPLQTFFKAHPLLLAPMAGITDMPFRSLCFEQGLFAAYTEMVSAKGLCLQPRLHENARRLLIAGAGETIALQLFGREPGYMAEAAARFAGGLLGEGPVPFAIDINMGCPAPKIVKNGEGAALVEEPALAAALVAAVSRAQPLPVTVKLRLGMRRGEERFLETAKACEQAGAAAICLHGRFREQYYSGEADWDAIRRAKESLAIPLIGNGDVRCAEDALRMRRETGCDAVMIGRAAQGNPFLFAECRAALEGRPYAQPSAGERLEMAERHLLLLRDFVGEGTCVREMRKHISWYTRGMRGSAEYRRRINTAASVEEVRELLLDMRAPEEI